MQQRLSFASDYMEGAHPAILQKLVQTNLEKTSGYGTDAYTRAAKEKIRLACDAPDADIFFLVGGTQTNATVIDAMLRGYQGVIAAESGHIAAHEAGAIEFGGHKVLTLPHQGGKLSAEGIRGLLDAYLADANHEHMVMPGMVYLSQPTEYGTLYSRAELTAISAVCHVAGIPLYLDGARLAYALACPENDVSLADLAALCDVFYIGGTKCGALFGEAVVIPKKDTIPHFFTTIKQHGALLAKGRLLGIQFDVLFTDGLYEKIGIPALQAAAQIRADLAQYGYRQCFRSPTNQVFCIMGNALLPRLEQTVEYGFWEAYDADHTIIRFASSWATTMQDVQALGECLKTLAAFR